MLYWICAVVQQTGYRIYSNGEIGEYEKYSKYIDGVKKEYDNYNKKGKISKSELKKLKKLISKLEHSTEKIDEAFPLSETTIRAYNANKREWFTLLETDTYSTKRNKTEAGKEILELTSEIEQKYLE